MSKKISIVFALLVGVLVGILLVVNLDIMDVALGQNKTKSIGRKNYQPPSSSTFLRQLNQSLQSVVSVVKPSVVTIDVEANLNNAEKSKEDFREDEELNPFFFFRQPRGKQKDDYIPIRASGSGVIVSSEGYIVTNNHVIERVKEKGSITVTLDDKRQFSAKIIGRDPLTDLAVIKIDGTDLQSISFGNSKDVQVGDFVLAIGNPLGLNSTVTAGIVSAYGRSIRIIDDSYGVEYFIQTDAAINSGNSGGALVDVDGRLIGINTAIATKTGGYDGYGFAIPIDLAESVIMDLIENGKVLRGYLGVSIRSVDAVTAKAMDLKKPEGVLVENILENSGAAEAGVKAGDIIIEVNDEKVKEANQLQSIIARKKPNEKIKLTLIRNKQLMTYYVYLKAKSGEKGFVANSVKNESNPKTYEDRRIGLVVSVQNKVDTKSDEKVTGVEVTQVVPFSIAQRRGVLVGDVIVEVSSKVVRSLNDFENYVKEKKPGEAILLRIKRKGNTSFVALEIPDEEVKR
ncbi:hypothetical protein CHS0354_000489 [Potamilus streckersoni]|uniref:PDZ domain-containing protein n=1 Tax=Potamilus streckersoni TaxID=2493646 RepID=A0AAE0T6Q0_9BIVA|nr:hypothetical protein CHS0354_000489 [Potamilus streckersoni]